MQYISILDLQSSKKPGPRLDGLSSVCKILCDSFIYRAGFCQGSGQVVLHGFAELFLLIQWVISRMVPVNKLPFSRITYAHKWQ